MLPIYSRYMLDLTQSGRVQNKARGIDVELNYWGQDKNTVVLAKGRNGAQGRTNSPGAN